MKLDRNRFSKKIGWCARRRALFTWNMWNRVKDWCRWLQEKMFSNKKGDSPIHSNCSKLPYCKKKCSNAQQQVTMRINRKSDQPRDQVQGSVSLLNRVGEGDSQCGRPLKQNSQREGGLEWVGNRLQQITNAICMHLTVQKWELLCSMHEQRGAPSNIISYRIGFYCLCTDDKGGSGSKKNVLAETVFL